MKLEDQVCSLEIAKRLKELGLKQQSLFEWQLFKSEHWASEIRLIYKENFTCPSESWSAFTGAELGEMLPYSFNIERDKYIFSEVKTFLTNLYCICYRNVFKKLNIPSEIIINVNEANARAQMLIYLLENSLMELPNE